MEQKKGLDISAKSFITAIIIIFVLMAVTYLLTFLIPGGAYARTTDASGNTVIDTVAGFQSVKGGLPFWKWILSPILVLGAEGSGTLIAVIIFLLVIGGVFNALNVCGLMNYMLDKLVARFGAVRWRLMAVLVFFFIHQINKLSHSDVMGPVCFSFQNLLHFKHSELTVLQQSITFSCHSTSFQSFHHLTNEYNTSFNIFGTSSNHLLNVFRNISYSCFLTSETSPFIVTGLPFKVV